MPSKYRFWFFLILILPKLILVPGITAEKICVVHSSKEVHMGSSFQISCIFKKDCTKSIYQDEVPVKYQDFNSTTVLMSIVNLTRRTTFTCKCNNHLEPCGADITPGYPPEVPQNLTCVQEGESGKVNCTWTMGLETYIRTTSILWVQGTPPVGYHSVALHGTTRSGTFPILDKQSQFSVQVNVTNSLGSAFSPVLSFKRSEIVRPLRPNIRKVECSSRQCHLCTDKTGSIQLVEVQYETNLKKNTIFLNHTNLWIIPSLSPYTLYIFRVRWKLGPTTGLWSEWSVTQNITDEEAPTTMLDVWYIELTTKTVIKSLQLFWKELSKSEARGKILSYTVSIMDQGKEKSIVIENSRSRHHNVSCSLCNVSVFANNSKGQSPPRVIQLYPITLLPLEVSHIHVNKRSVALSWPSSTEPVSEYLVEWYPVGRKQRLQWIRVKSHINTVNITGLEPAECYEGAVISMLSSETRRAMFSGIATWQSAPQHGPDCSSRVMNENVQVDWSEVPWEKRGGCLKKYTIYLEDLHGRVKNYSVLHPQRRYVLSGLTPGRYKLWVTAGTEAGEGPKGSEIQFIAKHPESLSAEALLILTLSVGMACFLTSVVVLCACHFSSVHRRFSQCCHCLMPSIVPDPANSKWAKECATGKGEMKLQLHLSDSSMSEEEPDTIEVQEVSQETLLEGETLPTTGAVNSVGNLHDQELHASAAPYQSNIISSYLKSFSHESSFSNTTRSTDITVDYISTHGLIDVDDDNDEVEPTDVFDFFPCPLNPLMEPLHPSGGNLTLDTVKIDCNDFLDCTWPFE